MSKPISAIDAAEYAKHKLHLLRWIEEARMLATGIQNAMSSEEFTTAMRQHAVPFPPDWDDISSMALNDLMFSVQDDLHAMIPDAGAVEVTMVDALERQNTAALSNLLTNLLALPAWPVPGMDPSEDDSVGHDIDGAECMVADLFESTPTHVLARPLAAYLMHVVGQGIVGTEPAALLELMEMPDAAGARVSQA